MVLTLASLCLIVGQDTRVAAVVVFVGVLSLERRNPFVFNAGDGLIRVIAFYLMFAPSGESLSLDRWRHARKTFWEFPARAPWALRLMQVQLSILYLASVWAKLAGETWNDGTAVSYAVRLEDLQRFEPPAALATSELVSNLLTYGTIAIEASLGRARLEQDAAAVRAGAGGRHAPGHRPDFASRFLRLRAVRALHRLPARGRGQRQAAGAQGPDLEARWNGATQDSSRGGEPAGSRPGEGWRNQPSGRCNRRPSLMR